MITDVIDGVIVLIIQIFEASVRPWRYCFSNVFRKEINAKLSDKPKYIASFYIFGSFILLAATLGIALILIYIFILSPDPDPTEMEKLKEGAKKLFLDTMQEAIENQKEN